jgi:hypothetical protein
MKSIFEEDTYNDVLQRINNIRENAAPEWGKMQAGQMFSHTKIPFEIVLEKRPPVGKSNFLMKLIFKKMMYNDKLFKKNMPTPKRFKISSDKDFNIEKQDLINSINDFYSQREKTDWPDHLMFGKFTADQTGQMMFKHLDHHLRQFGV